MTQKFPLCSALFLIDPCDTSFYNRFRHVMNIWSSHAHSGANLCSQPLGRNKGELIFLPINFLIYIHMSFTVSNTKCSNFIQFGGKEKGIQVHFQAGSCGVFSIRSSFRKGLFSRPDSNGPHRIFIFQWHYEQKGRNLSKKKKKKNSRSYNSNLLLAHFCIACLVSSV